MSLKPSVYQSINKKKNNYFKVRFEVLDKIEQPSKIDLWLTERYALFHKFNQEILTYQVHHLPWNLQEVNAENVQIDYPLFNPLINGTPNKIGYSKGTQVLAWSKQKSNA